ncbi:hypothetical protein PLESTB_000702700 [Pleodorina starrii]|uniref:Uncharacterized protein n=1 Tax=Pleodorina starrii TaxID=330485 RepID=A0A9W6BIX2_9CHLO|nr:hypothetical protein PLESTM_001214100 [Pleodorina starrii]GLC53051.1 hypothetical protein PLESTB_000702700 [Pleodorina starrii]GLC75003.1 hypothetical protein PLESTF_001582500 [Pleodorina starrii]
MEPFVRTFARFTAERRLWNDVLTTVLIICLVNVHAAKLLDLSRCTRAKYQHVFPTVHFQYPCNGSLESKSLSVIRNIGSLWHGIWRLRGPEMYLLGCVCATLSWFFVAVASIYNSTVRLLYVSGARVALLASTKFACKVGSIITLAVWRDAPLSSYCKWYLPVDGAVLLWQAYVAPVGAAAQATIAAADAACTFLCCWLLSDRWPYDNISTGTVLAINLLLACASLWLADRMEQSDRRDYERLMAAHAARAGAAAADAGAGAHSDDADVARGKTPRYLRATASGPAGCGVACCSVVCCGCGCGGRGSTDASAEPGGGGSGGGGTELSVHLLRQAAPGKDAVDAALAEAQSSQQPHPQQSLPQQREGVRSMGECCCLASLPLTYPGGAGASAEGAAAAGASAGGGSFSGSACGGGGGTAFSEASSPATFSSTRSLSRALPSFSTLSNCSTIGGAGGGSILAAGLASETGASSGVTSRPSSCLGALLAGRTATTTGQLQLQPGRARALAAVTVPPGPAVVAGCARTSLSCAAAPVATAAAPRTITSVVAVDAADVAAPVTAPVPPSSPSLALRSAELTEASVAFATAELDESGALHPTYAIVACDEQERDEGGGGGRGGGGCNAAPPPSPVVGPGAAAPSPQSSPGSGSLSGAGPLQQLLRRVQSLVTRGDAASAGATATLAAPSAAAAEPLTAAKTTQSGEASASGAASTSGSVSYCSSTSRSSEPRLCSYQWQEGTTTAATAAAATAAATAAAAALFSRGSASLRRRAAGEPAGADATQQRACCGPNDGAGAHAVGGATAAAKETWADSPVAASNNHLLVSADCVLAHPQPQPALANATAELQRRRLQQVSPQSSSSLRQFPQPHEPMAVVGFSALSADTVSPARTQQPQQQAPRPLQAAPAAAAARVDRAPPAANAGPRGDVAAAATTGAAGAVVAGGKTTGVPLIAAAAAAEPEDAQEVAAAALPRSPSPGAARYVTGDFGAATAGAVLSPCGTTHVVAVEPDASRTPRCYALARALAARGGCNALYDTPVLHHTRCNIKLDGLSPTDLPYGFADRVASLLAAAGGSAAAAMAAAAGHPTAATAALAAVGVYVREGCVELVADVVVPTGAAAAEAMVAGLAANSAHGGSEGRGGGGAGGAAALARMLGMAENAAAAALPQQPQEAAAVHSDRASAEAILDLLERSLLPQISNAVSPHPSTQGDLQPTPPPPLGSVAMQATVGSVQVMAWRDRPLAAAAPPPPPTIVCVTPCCVPLVQPSGDDTRDRRRQTVTLTVALAGSGVSADATAPPRLFVRHSGRCLAAVVRPCAERYVGCLAVTVELALSGIRPGLLFLEVAAADGGAALSLPWPVLVAGDSRVAAEVQQLQQQLEAAAPLRAIQAEAELLQFLRQRGEAGGGGDGGEPQWQWQGHERQQQLDGGTTSLLLDFGMWFEAVSAADAAVVAAATGRPAAGERAAASPRGVAPPLAAPPLPLPLTPPVTASAAEGEGEGYDSEVQMGEHEAEDEDEEALRQRGSGDGSSWESSSEEEEHSSHDDDAREAEASAALATLEGPPSRGGGGAAAAASGGDSCDGAADVGSDAEVQMLLLRSLQPEQELLEGSLDCAAEYERSCRQGPALQSAAAGLGMRLLRFAVLRGWPAAATLLLRGLLVHCRLGFGEVAALFRSAAGGAAGMPLLHTAVMSGSLAMVRTVKAWAQRYRAALSWDEAVPAAGGLTPLHLAAVQENGRLAGAILGLWPEAEAQWAVARDRDGHTPLEYAHMRAMGGGTPGAGASAGAAPPAAAGKAVSAEAAPPPGAGALLLPGCPAARAREWSQAGELEEVLAAAAAPPPRPQLQQSQRVGALAEGSVAAPQRPAGGPYEVTFALPAVRRRSRPQSPLLQEAAGGGDGGAVASAAAADRSDGNRSCASSMLMSSLAAGGTCAGSGLSRLDRTSDCGSLSMGPDSQWSHSTNATALAMQYSHLPTGALQDLRGGGHSPVKVAALSATLLSLANLPDGGGSGSSEGASASAGASGSCAAGASGSCAAGVGVGVACLSNGSSGKQQQRQLMALSTVHGLLQPPPHHHQQQQRLQAQSQQQRLPPPPPQQQQQQTQQQQPEPGGAALASFQLDLASGRKTAPLPPGLPPQLQQVLSPQLQKVLQQQQQLMQQQQQQQSQTLQPRACLSPPARHAPAAGGNGGGGLSACGASPLGLRPPQHRQDQLQELGEIEPQSCAQTQASEAQLPVSPGCAAPPGGSSSPLVAAGAGLQLSSSTPGALAAVDALAGAGAGAAAGMHAAAAINTATVAPPAPAPAAAAPQPAAAKPPHQQSQHRAAPAAAVAPPPPPVPPRSRLSTRGVRLLAMSLLHNGSTSAGSPPRTTSPPESTSSPFSAAAAVGASTSYSMHSTAGSVASTLSLSTGTARRRASGDGRFSANTRRAAFADDYAPACQPTLAARTTQLADLLPLLSAARRAPGGGADRAAAARAALLAAARTTALATAAASATGSDAKEGPAAGPAGKGWGGGGGSGGGRSLLPLSASLPAASPAETAPAATGIPEARIPEDEAVAGVAPAAPPPQPSPRAGLRVLQAHPRADMHLVAEEAAAGAAAAAAVGGAAAQSVAALVKAPRLEPQLRLGLAAGVVLLAALVLPVISKLMAF